MRTPATVLLCLTLAACGGGDAPRPARILDAPQEAVSRTGDVTVRANLVRTDALGPEMARVYGIDRDERTVLLMVSVRKGPESQEIALPATVSATVTGLQGQPHGIAMREVRTGAYIDYIGTTAFAAPDTLRFDLRIRREDGAVSTMRFTREFLPQ